MTDRRELRLISWNVNGLRAVLKKEPGFVEIAEGLGADVIAVQETKLQEGQVELDLPGYVQTWSYAERSGYSGTAVFSRERPLQVVRRIDSPAADDEGRVCALEFPTYWFVCAYVPNAQPELKRIETRLAWDESFRGFLAGLAREKTVVACGDFNVAHEEIDLRNPAANRGNAGFSDEERGSFGRLLDAGFVDTFRQLHPTQTEAYSWWSYRMRARANNAGWRIDYFLVSQDAAADVTGASILSEVPGSDHCPVELTIKL